MAEKEACPGSFSDSRRAMARVCTRSTTLCVMVSRGSRRHMFTHLEAELSGDLIGGIASVSWTFFLTKSSRCCLRCWHVLIGLDTTSYGESFFYFPTLLFLILYNDFFINFLVKF